MTWSLPGLRGATQLRHFHSKGDDYLIAAQSTCRRRASRGECTDLQPRSAVLQYDVTTGLFGELLAITRDDAERVHGRQMPAGEVSIHQAALRIQAGRAVDWEFVEQGGSGHLYLSSISHGCVALAFDFDIVAGLAGASHALQDPHDPSSIYAVSGRDASLVTMYLDNEYDVLGYEPGGGCNNDVCIKYMPMATLSSNSLKTGDMSKTSEEGGVDFMSGAARLQITDVEAGGEHGPFRSFTVETQMPRTEFQCGEVPPVNVGGDAVAPACQPVKFGIDLLGGGVPNGFFAVEPRIDTSGTLSFEVNPLTIGTVRFNVTLSDSAGGVSQAGEMSIRVINVNHAPTFTVQDVDGGVGLGLQELVFATGIIPGPPHEDDQELSWASPLDYTEQDSFKSAPNVTIRRAGFAPNGQQLYEGVVQFEAKEGIALSSRVTVVLRDNGPRDRARGDVGVSQPQTFFIRVQAVNQAPSFELIVAGFSIFEGAPVHGPTQVATGMNYGADAHPQNLTLSMTRVERLNGLFDPDNLFSYFNLTANGHLSFETSPFYNGDFLVYLTLRDDGGTDFGGTDSVTHAFYINITAVSSFPNFTSPSQVTLLETREETPVEISGIITNVSLLPLDERDKPLKFVVTDNSRPDLFLQQPAISPDGTLTLMLVVGISGDANLTFALEDQTGLGPPSYLLIHVITVNNPPSFSLGKQVAVVEGAPLTTVADFVRDIVPGPPDERDQIVSFILGVTTLTPSLFSDPPAVDADGGVLSFRPAPGQHGTATVNVRARDSGGTEYGGVDTSVDMEQSFELKVYPAPRITSLSPRIGPLSGSVRVTVLGNFFGSLYSRGYASDAYGNITVGVGGRSCEEVTFLSDTEVECTVGQGSGTSDVVLSIEDGLLTRSASLEAGFTHSNIYAAGALSGNGDGFVATGPRSDGSETSMAISRLEVSRVIRTMITLGKNVYAGGAFITASGKTVNHIISWEGNDARSLGYGVDGAVNSMLEWGTSVIVAGAMTRAYQVQPLPSPTMVLLGLIVCLSHK